MSNAPSQLTRPLLIFLILATVAAVYILLQPTIQPPPVVTRIVQQPSSTPTTTHTPNPTITAVPLITTPFPTETPLPPATAEPPTPTIPPTPLPTATPARIRQHTVQSGETVDSIAAQYSITAASIAALNYLIEPDILFPGQTLDIPLYPKPTVPASDVNTAITNALETTGTEPVTLGYSVLDRPIELYTFGGGPNTLIFIGGLHGGYEWNSTVLAYEFIDYFKANPTAVPETVTAHIIPAANPDGIHAVTGKTGPITAGDILYEYDDTFPARFNANGVDLNRNWGCEWSPTAVWWDETISGGSAPYSEIENKILLAFIESQEATLKGVIFWHSSAFLVSPGHCGDDIHQPSIDIAAAYAQAARYPVGDFDAYPITGEASNSLAEIGVPSFSVELSSHEAIDWIRNLDGMEALFALFS